MKKNNKTKTEYSTFSNVFYILGLMFKISPMLVIGEIIMHLLCTLPGRLVSVIGLKFVIDEVSGGGDPKRIILGISLILGVLIFGDVINALFFELFVHRQREKLDLGLQSLLYKKAASLDLSKYDNPGYYADFILAVENSSDNIRYMLGMVKGYIEEILSFILIGSLIFTIDPVALVIVLISSFIFIPVGRYTGKLMVERREKITELHRVGDYFARIFYLQEYAGEIRTSGVFPLLRRRFSESADNIIGTQKKFVKKLDRLFFFQETTIYVIGYTLILTIYIGYKTIVTGEMTSGDFVATFNGAISLGGGILYLTVYSVRWFTERSKMIDKYRKFLKTDNDIRDGYHIALCGKPETITVKDITFSYENNEKNSLDGISFEIKPYEKVALVGYNGAGKTTLTNLLLRLYDVKGGSIEIGGRDIREETVESHRARFAAVFQDFQIFSASVGENVALSKEYDEKRVWEALQCAGFDKELPDGLKTILLREFDENGLMLSGGEQQKIAIARAFYKDCPYVILDEPSANLDPISEYELNHAMMTGAENKTVIFISHRLSTTRNADRIFMMEKGKIIESGSHEELINLGGKYAEMFNLQAEKYQSQQN
ncbi:MAG: ABC transporter ATP-binding protein [Clostridia bacterium]|nr:ABC transporter ATP-binding protein [Clostridia bacterium]